MLFTGGSAFGLAAADGVVRWLDERGIGYTTPVGLVPIVPAAVIYDLAVGDPRARPGPEAGYAACEAAAESVPERGAVGAGTGAAVGKILGRERAVQAGVGFAAGNVGRGNGRGARRRQRLRRRVRRGRRAARVRDDATTGSRALAADVITAAEGPPEWASLLERNTTLVCVMTDAAFDKAACTRIARMASGGVARAVDPVFSDVDGDVAFCIASGEGRTDRFDSLAVGTLAATLTAAAIRDAVRAAGG